MPARLMWCSKLQCAIYCICNFANKLICTDRNYGKIFFKLAFIHRTKTNGSVSFYIKKYTTFVFLYSLHLSAYYGKHLFSDVIPQIFSIVCDIWCIVFKKNCISYFIPLHDSLKIILILLDNLSLHQLLPTQMLF